MASTNKTPNIELSQFTATDKPSWQLDYNGDMLKIDTAMGGKANEADVAAALALKADGSSLQAHIQNTNNPHDVSAEQVNTYTKQEIDALLADKANATDLSDTGWKPLQLKNGFTLFVTESGRTCTARYRKIGKRVHVEGIIAAPASSGTDTIGSLNGLVFATLPATFRPSEVQVVVEQGTVHSIWTLRIEPAGDMKAMRHRVGGAYTTPAAHSWLPFTHSFLVD